MDMDIVKARKYSAWLELFILMSIGIYLISYVYTKNYIKDIDENFNKQRNKPCTMITGPLTGRSSSNIMQSIMGEKTKGVFKIFSRFLRPIFKLIADIFRLFRKNIDKIRSSLNPIRQYFYNATKIFYDQIEKFTIGILYSVHKMRNTMKRSMSGFHLMLHTLEHTRNNLLSVIRSTPVKLTVKFLSTAEWIYDKAFFLCFDENTLIKLADNTYLKISDISIGDILEDNSSVIAVHKFKNNKFIYNYNDIYVSGDHIVKEDNKWLKVCDSNLSEKISVSPKYLYCLSTTSGIIPINNVIFKDFEGSTNDLINLSINSLILMKLNNNQLQTVNINDYAYNNKYLENGFAGNTLIEMNNGTNKRIDEIDIDDILLNNNKVLGKVVIDGSKVDFYNDNGIIVTSNTKTKSDKGVWKNIEKCDRKKILKDISKAYNLVTETQKINVYPNRIYTDYIEINDKSIEEHIERLVIN